MLCILKCTILTIRTPRQRTPEIRKPHTTRMEPLLQKVEKPHNTTSKVPAPYQGLQSSVRLRTLRWVATGKSRQ